MYDNYRTFDLALKNQLLVVFYDPYLATLKNKYTEYATRSTMDLIYHLYKDYSRSYSTDVAANNKRLQVSYNDEEPLKSLI